MDIREAAGFGFRQYLVKNETLSMSEISIYSRLSSNANTAPGYYKRYTFKFPNGYGASVIRTPGSYGSEVGQWELAVIYDNRICYDTEITSDVMGYLTHTEVHNTLKMIEQLQPRDEHEEVIYHSEAQERPGSDGSVFHRQDGGKKEA
jgi:hypothetical protein